MSTSLTLPATAAVAGPQTPVSAAVGAGGTPTRAGVAQYVTTLTADTETGRTLRGLLAELAQIDQDRAMALKFPRPGSWLAELTRQAHAVWADIKQTIAAAHTA